MWGVTPEVMLRNAAAHDNGSANDDLEMDRKLTKETHAPLKTDTKDMDEIENDKSKELLRSMFTQADIVLDNNLEEIHEATQRNRELAKVEIGEMEGVGPGEVPGNAAWEDVATAENKRDVTNKLEGPDAEKAAAEGISES